MVPKKPETRTERDSRGEVQIPLGIYWGAETERARQHFSISTLPIHARFFEAFVLFKKAAAQANSDFGRLELKLSRAIGEACDEILSGQLQDQFPIDAFQPGVPHAVNANINEVVANRGNELLGGAIGNYDPIHPSKHVNLGQAINDTYPTAMRVAILLALKDLEPALLDLERLLRRKSLEFERIVKVGRTHLQDTAPVTLGQEFNAYGSSVERAFRRIKEAKARLLEVNVGAASVGTGFNSEPRFAFRVIEKLSQSTGFALRQADDLFRATQSMADFMEFSSALKELAVEMTKIANDLKLLSSGPRAGIGEIVLPPQQTEPSVLMPGQLPDRANPILPECLNAVSYQVVGNDLAVTMAAQGGQLESNGLMPLISHNILQSMDLLRNIILAFNQYCLAGITANTARCRELFESSGSLTTVLAPLLGFTQANDLVKEAQSTGKEIRQLVLEKKLIPQEVLDKLLNYKYLTSPGSLPIGSSGEGTTGGGKHSGQDIK